VSDLLVDIPPSDFINQRVYVTHRMFMQGKATGGFPGVHGTLLAIGTRGSVRVRAEHESIWGPAGDIWIPNDSYQAVNQISSVVAASPRVSLS
jgi:hypothetical protein